MTARADDRDFWMALAICQYDLTSELPPHMQVSQIRANPAEWLLLPSTRTGHKRRLVEHNSGHGVTDMRSESNEHTDPQWELTLEIASKLWYYGQYTFDLDPSPQQRLVDVHWAALQAGRLLGVRAKINVSAPSSKTEPTVTVTIAFDDSDGRSRARAQEGFETLLRSVHEQYRH
jgi:hypothetical protein